jgi:hypothetical protein
MAMRRGALSSVTERETEMRNSKTSVVFTIVPLLLLVSTLASAQPGQGQTLPVRDVENPARQPFQRELQIAIPAGSNGASETFTVPAGKRLVLEYIAATVAVFPGQKGSLRITNTAGGTLASYDLHLEDEGVGFTGFAIFRVSQQIRIYADPGSTVTVVVGSDGATLPVTIGELVTLSGYLVTL